ncbi:DUF4386 domain-containing protein [Egibacter rhizosphaerae]|nr:DUF4386 domain-containing protein [Egibacter rhizosphaerae]
MSTSKHLARTAGALYLLMAVLGGIAHLGVRADIRVPGEAAATAANIAANPTLFRFSLVADIAMATIFVFVGVAFYLLLRHVDRHAAGLLVIFVAVAAGMILVNLVFHHAALLVATDPAAYAVDAHSADSLALLLVDMHHHGYTIAGVFFGLWLLPLGYLAYRSGLFSRVLSVLLVVAGAAWIVGTLVEVLCPDLPAVVHAIISAPTIAEFWMVAYLIIKGVRTPTSDQLATPAT